MQTPATQQEEKALHFGPLAVNTATTELKSITKALLNGSKSICTNGPLGLEMEIDGKKHNITLLIESADFSQLVLDPEDIAKYPAILAQTTEFKTSDWVTEKEVRKRQDSCPKIKDLKYGEVQAINVYTGPYYRQINGLLRGTGLPLPFKKKELPKEPQALNDYAAQLLLVSILSVSGLNRIEETTPLPADSASMRDDDEYLPAPIVNARLKAIDEYKKRNYVGSIDEMQGFVSTTEVSYKYRIVSNENDVVSEKFDIGFYVADDHILVKAKGVADVKIQSPDPLFDAIKSMHDKGLDFTANDTNVKILVLNDPRLAGLIWTETQCDSKYKTKFTNLVGKNVSEISNTKTENEILLPPVHIQWVDVQIINKDTKNEKVFFTGHPVSVLEIQKDVTIARGYNALASLQADVNKLDEPQKDLLKRLKNIQSEDVKTHPADNIWQASATKLVADYINRLEETKLAVQEIARDIKTLADLRANVDKVLNKADDLAEIDRTLKDEKRMLLRQFDIALDTLLSNEKLNLEVKTNLLDIKNHLNYYLKSPKVMPADLSALSETIREKGPMNDKTADEVLNIALDRMKALVAVKKEPEKTLTMVERSAIILPSKSESMLSVKDFKSDGGQRLGSNPGGMYTGPNEKKYYLKFPAQKHGSNPSTVDDITKNEVLTAKLYKLAGIKVPTVMLIEDKDGHLGIASEIEATFKKAASYTNKTDLVNLPGFKEGFAADCWLANWDVVGLEYDNIGTHTNPENGTLEAYRLDTGGGLLYRAQGAPKGKAFTNEVSELDTMRGKNPKIRNPQAEAFFKNIDDCDPVFLSGAQKIAEIPPEKIRELVMAYGPGDDKHRAQLADTLISRQNNLVMQLQKQQTANDTHSVEASTLASSVEDEQKKGWLDKIKTANPGELSRIIHYKLYNTQWNEKPLVGDYAKDPDILRAIIGKFVEDGVASSNELAVIIPYITDPELIDLVVDLGVKMRNDRGNVTNDIFNAAVKNNCTSDKTLAILAPQAMRNFQKFTLNNEKLSKVLNHPNIGTHIFNYISSEEKKSTGQVKIILKQFLDNKTNKGPNWMREGQRNRELNNTKEPVIETPVADTEDDQKVKM